MPTYAVKTAHQSYPVVVARGALARISEFIPASAGNIFVVTTRDVWDLHQQAFIAGIGGRSFTPLFFPGGEQNKRLNALEELAEQMMRSGGDRSSLVIAFGGGIVGDVGGFLAAIFMRGVPLIQVPTTLLAQVDAAVGGKTGVNLVAGKNLIGSFHQPIAVLIDPEVLRTLPNREYRAGLFEVVKHGIIASEDLFRVMAARWNDVLSQTPDVVEYMIGESVRIKAQVVSEDEKEGDLRRILNFGHTFGHALEAETSYTRFLHGEAVAWGMKAASFLAARIGLLPESDRDTILKTISLYGPIPPLDGIAPSDLASRLISDKKSVQGKVHFVLPDRIGHVVIRSGVDPTAVLASIEDALSARDVSA